MVCAQQLEGSCQSAGKTSILVTAFPEGSETLLLSAAIVIPGAVTEIRGWGRELFLSSG